MMADWKERWETHLKANLADSTERTYISHVSTTAKDVDGGLLDIDPYTLESYLNGLKTDEDGLSGNGLQTRFYAIQSFFSYVEERKDGFESPMEPLDKTEYNNTQSRSAAERQKQGRDGHKYLTTDEIDAMIEAADSVRDKAIIGVLSETGVRAGELSQIRLNNIEWEEQRIYVESLKKQNRTQTRPVLWWTDRTDQLLRLWHTSNRNGLPSAADSPYLFPTQRRERIREQMINDIVKDAADGAGLQEVLWTDSKGRDQHEITTHTLRHTAIRRWVRDLELSLPTVKKIAGHSSIDITDIYAEPTDEEAIAELQRQARRNG